jgi:hypothetical protein
MVSSRTMSVLRSYVSQGRLFDLAHYVLRCLSQSFYIFILISVTRWDSSDLVRCRSLAYNGAHVSPRLLCSERCDVYQLALLIVYRVTLHLVSNRCDPMGY